MRNTRAAQSATVKGRKPAKPAPAPQPETVDAAVVETPIAIEDEASPLDLVLADLGASDDARVMVYRVGNGQALQYVATMRPEEIAGEASLFEMIRQDYGGGVYRVHVRDRSGLIANRRVEIAERRERKPEDFGTVLLGAIKEQGAQLAEAIKAMAPRPAEQPSEEQLLQRLKLYRDVFAPAKGGAVDTAELLKLFREGLQLGRSIDTGGGVDPSQMIVEGLRTIRPLLAMAQQPARAVQTNPAPGGASPAAPAPAAPTDPTASPSAVGSAVRALMGMAIAAAERDSDPELYAHLLLDQFPAAELRQLLAMPDPVALLADFDPRVAQHRDWFADLADALRELLADDDAQLSGRPADGQGGSAAHAAHDGGAHPPGAH
jgi:hypothetical protein